MKKKLLLIAALFAVITIAARILPHVPNVAPMAALALFSGVYLPRRWSIPVALSAMLISDVFVGFYEWQVMLVVYASFAATVMLGWWVSKKVHPLTVAGGSVVGTALFFVTSNAAVWAFTQLYAHTAAGLLNSYLMAVPFLKFSLVGDLAWTTVFFVGYQAVLSYFPQASLREHTVSSAFATQGH